LASLSFNNAFAAQQPNGFQPAELPRPFKPEKSYAVKITAQVQPVVLGKSRDLCFARFTFNPVRLKFLLIAIHWSRAVRNYFKII